MQRLTFSGRAGAMCASARVTTAVDLHHTRASQFNHEGVKRPWGAQNQGMRAQRGGQCRPNTPSHLAGRAARIAVVCMVLGSVLCVWGGGGEQGVW